MEIIGVYGGLSLALLGWFLGRGAAQKNRGLDEMHDYIWNKARSISWYLTIATIYILMTLYIAGVNLNVMVALSILLFVQLASWAISGIMYGLGFTGIKLKKGIVIQFTVIGVFVPIAFIILAATIDNWKIALASIPPMMVNIGVTVNALRKAKAESVKEQ